MRVKYCKSCGRNTGHGRNIGVGSLILVLLTWGFWAFVLLFYPARCKMCGVYN